MNPLSKGVTTSELAVTIGTVVASLLVTFGVISADQAHTVATALTNAITGAVALAVIYGVVSQYVKGRNDLKMAQLTGNPPITISSGSLTTTSAPTTTFTPNTVTASI